MGKAKSARKRRRLRRWGRRALVALGVLFIGFIFYLGVTWGPRPVDSEPRRTVEEVNPELLEESKELEREFDTIASQREPNEEELDVLREAIARQRDYNDSATRPSSENRRRLRALETRLGTYLAKELHAESVQAEEEAQRLRTEGEVERAVERMKYAYELQGEINEDYSRSGYRDVTRESRLQREVASLEAEPIHQRSVELESQADEAIEEFQWEEARDLLDEALELQVTINDSSRRNSYHNTARVNELNEKIASLRVGEMASEVQDLQEQGQLQESQGQAESAAEMYERAMVLQNQINRDHPQSQFVSRAKVSELDAARHTALSARTSRELETALDEMRAAIRQGDSERAGEKVEEARGLLAQIFDRFPRSRYADFNIRREVEFLDRVEEDLPELQELLREDLLPLPGEEGEWKMTAAPVSQDVYSRIMNANPSRNLGKDLPVDSVTIEQARNFCRRASWILGRTVKLPEWVHFEAALGEWDPEAYSAMSWHSENSGGNSHPVTSGAANPHGFFHLAGNVRHWLSDAGEDGSRWTAGMSFADELPEGDLFHQISQDERAPTIGFRYVVAAD